MQNRQFRSTPNCDCVVDSVLTCWTRHWKSRCEPLSVFSCKSVRMHVDLHQKATRSNWAFDARSPWETSRDNPCHREITLEVNNGSEEMITSELYELPLFTIRGWNHFWVFSWSQTNNVFNLVSFLYFQETMETMHTVRTKILVWCLLQSLLNEGVKKVVWDQGSKQQFCLTSAKIVCPKRAQRSSLIMKTLRSGSILVHKAPAVPLSEFL